MCGTGFWGVSLTFAGVWWQTKTLLGLELSAGVCVWFTFWDSGLSVPQLARV